MNLRAKTSLTSFVFISLVLLTYTYINIRQEEKEEEKQVLSSGLHFAALTSAGLVSQHEKCYERAFHIFHSYLKELRTHKGNLFRIEIVDVEGNVRLGLEELETSNPQPLGRKISPEQWEYETLTWVTPQSRYITIDGKHLLEVSSPVILPSGIHRYNVIYYYSFDDLEKRLGDIKASATRLFLIFVSIGLLGSFLFSYGLTRNLKRLVKHAYLIAGEDLEEPVRIHSKDELGELSSSMEHMRGELKKKSEEIASYNRELEKKVSERTEALEALTVQLRQNNVVLQKANEKLLELDRLKSEFLASTSHELRTPLTSIIGYSQCVLAELDGPIPEKQKENIRKIISSGKDLLSLINRILDFSKIKSGRLKLDIARTDLKEVIEEAVTTVRPMSEEKGLSLIANIESNLPPLPADRMRIKQAILNLLSNAIKFTDEGFISIRAFRNNGDLQISVQDTGIGIGKENHETIFDAFRQVDGSAQRKFGGSGLGLTISKMLIELHKGRIWIQSDKGKGTTFSFTLPISPKENDDGTQNL